MATWNRTPGYTRDEDGRTFAQALARKRVRFAFPDDFTGLVKKLQSRLGDKHDKNTDEGRGLRALREIRVQASPAWDGPRVDVFFWFIRDEDEADCEGRRWVDLLAEWMKLVPTGGRFNPEGQVVTLEDMSAADYVASDRLGLDHFRADPCEERGRYRAQGHVQRLRNPGAGSALPA